LFVCVFICLFVCVFLLVCLIHVVHKTDKIILVTALNKSA